MPAFVIAGDLEPSQQQLDIPPEASLHLTFHDSGAVVLPLKYAGYLAKVTATGGGGGGSVAVLRNFTGRVGAGGGSGAVDLRVAVVAGTRTIQWKLGKGGAGGKGGKGWEAMRGQTGGSTQVALSFGPSFLAEGGEGGIYVSSGLTAVKTDVSDFPAPSMGGSGGLPSGVAGDDGMLDIRFKGGGVALGGLGGRLTSSAGNGGDGAGLDFSSSVGDTVFDGFPGSAGLVEIELWKADSRIGPPTLGVPEKRPNALDRVFTSLLSACAANAEKCPAEFLKITAGGVATQTAKGGLVFVEDGLTEAAKTLLDLSGIPTKRWEILKKSLTIGSANAPTAFDHNVSSKLKDLTGEQLLNTADLYDAAAERLEKEWSEIPSNTGNNAVLTANNLSVANSFRAYAKSLRNERLGRLERGIADSRSRVDYYGGSVRNNDSPPPKRNDFGPGRTKPAPKPKFDRSTSNDTYGPRLPLPPRGGAGIPIMSGSHKTGYDTCAYSWDYCFTLENVTLSPR